MRDCEYYQKLISDQLDEPLAAERAEELRAHLVQCPACREFLAAIQKQSELIRMLAIDDGGAHLKTLHMPAPKSPPLLHRVWRTRLSLPLPVAASLLAVWILSGLFFATNRPGEAGVALASDTPVVECVHTLRLTPSRPIQLTLSNDLGEEETK